MRKILVIISLIALVFIGNFSLWFLHTRTIHAVLAQFKRELSHHNVTLSFDDIKFTNFKSWRVDGNIKKVSISYGKTPARVIDMENLKFQSLPFDKQATLIADDKITISTKNGKDIIDSYNVSFREGEKPKVVLNFETALKNIVDELKDPEEPKLHLIDSIAYTDSGFDVYDAFNNTLFFEVGPAMLNMDTSKNDKERRFEFALNFKGLIFNKNYIPPQADEAMHKVRLQLGPTEFDIEFSYVETQSRMLLDLISKDKENKKNYKRLFDSYQVEIRQMRQGSEAFNMNLTGSLDRQPDTLLPLMDLNLRIDKYKNFAIHMTNFYNAILGKMLAEQPHFPAERMTPERVNRFIAILSKMGPVNDDLDIRIIHRRGEDFNIAGRPFFTLLHEFQSIFIDEKQKR